MAAEQGHAAAQCNLAVCYANGYGVAQHMNEAIRWWRQATFCRRQAIRITSICRWPSGSKGSDKFAYAGGAIADPPRIGGGSAGAMRELMSLLPFRHNLFCLRRHFQTLLQLDTVGLSFLL